MSAVADRADHAQRFLLVDVGSRRFLSASRPPVDLLLFEDLDHVDVDEVEPSFIPGDVLSSSPA